MTRQEEALGATDPCPHCGAATRHTTMREEGVDYSIWACTESALHWGSS